jgi:hypothetical protein
MLGGPPLSAKRPNWCPGAILGPPSTSGGRVPRVTCTNEVLEQVRTETLGDETRHWRVRYGLCASCHAREREAALDRVRTAEQPARSRWGKWA